MTDAQKVSISLVSATVSGLEPQSIGVKPAVPRSPEVRVRSHRHRHFSSYPYLCLFSPSLQLGRHNVRILSPETQSTIRP